MVAAMRAASAGFARQQWRAWIETFEYLLGERGHGGFARQQWRAWIETLVTSCLYSPITGFARQQWRAWIETVNVINYRASQLRIRPPAMAGVD